MAVKLFISHSVSPKELALVNNKNKVSKQLAAIKRAFGLLTDLTPEELHRFDEAVKRRPLIQIFLKYPA